MVYVRRVERTGSRLLHAWHGQGVQASTTAIALHAVHNVHMQRGSCVTMATSRGPVTLSLSSCSAAAATAAAAPQARMKQLVLDEVKGYFRPELLNRFDEQIVFHKLGLKEVRHLLCWGLALL